MNRRRNKLLDASSRGVFRNLIRPAMLDENGSDGRSELFTKSFVDWSPVSSKEKHRIWTFYTGDGIAWFLGSAAMGLLYDESILAAHQHNESREE